MSESFGGERDSRAVGGELISDIDDQSIALVSLDGGPGPLACMKLARLPAQVRGRSYR